MNREYDQTFVLTITGLVRDVVVGGGELSAEKFEAAFRVTMSRPAR